MRYALLAAGSLLCAPAMANAQTAAGEAGGRPTAGASARDSGMDDIIVTARRREEMLQDVPISVSALSATALERNGVKDMQSLQYQTPSLSLSSSNPQRNNASFALRGQRTGEVQLFTDPAVGTYFAEVVQPRPYGFGNALFDLQSVQVLKGVQGTLFGRNMTGGAILIEPAHPKLGSVEGYISGSVGNYDLREAEGMVNLPIGDTIALRVAGRRRTRDGFSRDVETGRDYDDQNYTAFRISLLAAPVDRLETLTIFDFYRSMEHGTALFLTSIKLPSVISNYENLRNSGVISTNIPAQFAEARALFEQRRFSFNIGAGDGSNLDAFGKPYEFLKNYGITNKTTYDIGDNLKLKNIFGYRYLAKTIVQDYDGIPAFIITPRQFSRIETYSEELQLQGKAFDNRLDFVLGGYFFEESGLDGSFGVTTPQLVIAGSRQPQSTPAIIYATRQQGAGVTRSYAAFAGGTFALTDSLKLSAGVRYNRDKRQITVNPQQPNLNGGTCTFDTDIATPGVQSVPIGQCSFSDSISFNRVTYDATIQYDAADGVNAYLSYRRGYRAGGYTTRAVDPISLRPFQPETVDEYELGLKTSTPLGAARLTTSTALFLQNGSDVQKTRSAAIDTNGDGTPDTIFTVIDNTAKQRNYGGEFEAQVAFPGGLSLSAFYSYTKVEIVRGARVVGGLPEIAQRGFPKHQAGITVNAPFELPQNLGRLDLTANVTYRSANYLDDFEIEGRQPGFALVNLRAEWAEIGGSGFSLAAFANNLTDRTYRVGVLGLMVEGVGIQSSLYGVPRIYGLQGTYRF